MKKKIWPKRWLHIGAIVLGGLIVSAAIAGCAADESSIEKATSTTAVAVKKITTTSSTTSTTSEKPTTTTIKPKTTSTTAADNSDARRLTQKVKADLDTTTLEDFMVQMPDDIQPEAVQDGQNRKFTWKFPDDSQLMATFRPLGGEGSQQGLVLYMVDIKD